MHGRVSLFRARAMGKLRPMNDAVSERTDERPLRLALAGARGRLGRRIVEAARGRADIVLTEFLERDGAVSAEEGGRSRARRSHEAALRDADVLLDVTQAEATVRYAALCAEAGRPFVTGVTGLDAAQARALQDAARTIPVLHARNFSLAVTVMEALVAKTAAALAAYDVEIVEIHHAAKRDAPSGTALALAESAAHGRGVALEIAPTDRGGSRKPGAVGFAVARGGGVVGEHAVRFEGPDDTFIIEHRARDRRLFADGALTAARLMKGRRSGFYAMGDLLGL